MEWVRIVRLGRHGTPQRAVGAGVVLGLGVALARCGAQGTAAAPVQGEPGVITGWGAQVVGPEFGSGLVAVAAGGMHSLGLKAEGSIVAWGANWYGQCDVLVPNTGFVAVTAGESHNLGLSGYLRGDLNCNGSVNFGDINPFVLYLSNFVTWQAEYIDCPPENGDINGDGTYGQASLGDINPFVELLTR